MGNVSNATDNTRELSRTAVQKNKNIRNEVRDIVVKALMEHKLDSDNVKQVIDAVLDGATKGAPSSKGMAQALKETVDGLDEGLAKAAEASKLAIEEASGRVGEFSENDIKRAVDDLKGLESLLTDALKDLVKAGRTTTKGALKDLVAHTERTGTSTGRSVANALDVLRGSMSRMERPEVSDVETAARVSVATIASIASGILEGLADSVRHEDQRSDADSDGEIEKKV